jgi:hypothetical protein
MNIQSTKIKKEAIMKLGKPQGVLVLFLGLCLLTGGILVLITVPSWGNWISDYPEHTAQVISQQAPAQAAPIAQAVLSFVLGPLIQQIGGYIKTAGYFVGSLLTLISLTVSFVGSMIIKRA